MDIVFEGREFVVPDGTDPEQAMEMVQAVPEPSGPLRRYVGDPLISAVKGAIGVPELFGGLEDIATGGRAGKIREWMGFRPKEAKAFLDTYLSPEQQAVNAEVKAAKGFTPTVKAMVQNPSTIVHSAIESAPSMGAGGVIGRGIVAAVPAVSGLVAGAVGEGIASAGSTAAQIRQDSEDGLLSVPQRALAAGSGALTGALGLLGGKLAQKLGVTDIDTWLAGKVATAKAAGDKGPGLIRRVIEGALSEGVLEELPQSAQEQIAYNLALGKPWAEGVPEAAAGGMLVGGLMGGGVAVVKNPLAGGADNGELPAPKPGEPVIPPTPTIVLDSSTSANLDTIAKSIDPTTITAEQVAQDKADLAAARVAQASPPVPGALESWGPTLTAQDPDVGATRKQTANEVNYPNSNDEIDFAKRRFVLSSVPEIEGKTPEQVAAQPGTHILGDFTEDRPEGMMRALLETYEPWRQKYLPNATLIISNESLAMPSSQGSHTNLTPGVHKIVPGVLRSPKDINAFNPNARAGLFYTATHEFGHAIINDRFYGDLPPELAQQIKLESQAGMVSPEAVSALEAIDPRRAAVVQEFNALKQGILDGTLTAEDFTKKWIGPAKLGRDFLGEKKVLPQAPAQDIVDAMVRDTIEAMRRRGITKGFAEVKRAYQKGYFSLDEYMAEQTARHAYAQKWDVTSQLGQYLGDVIQRLRQFFIDLKKDGYIKPGVAFAEWLEGLGHIEDAAKPRVKAAKAAKQAGKTAKVKAEAKAPAKPKVAKPKIKVEKVEHNVATDTDAGKAADARKITANLIKSGAIEANSAEFKELSQYIRDNDWEAFRERFQQLAGKSVSWELDGESEFLGAARARHEAESKVPQERFDKLTKVWQTLDRAVENQWDLKAHPLEFLALSGNKVVINDLAVAKQMRDRYDALRLEQMNKINESARKLLKIKQQYDKAGGTNYELDTELDFTKPTAQAALGQLTEAQLTPEVIAEAQEVWTKEGPKGKFFKSFFGNWEIEGSDHSQAKTYKGEPLVLYHATKQDFTSFERGDLGFHFGTLRAAHNRHYDAADFVGGPGSLEGSQRRYELMGQKLLGKVPGTTTVRAESEFELRVENIRFIPIVLNIRSPLNFGTEYTDMWQSPYASIEALRKEGYASDEENDAILKEIDALTENATAKELMDLYKLQAPVRNFLLRKGYDGIKYVNTVEGDTSWVAFKPEQVKSLLGSKTFSKSRDFNYELDYDLSTPEGSGASQLLKGTKPWWHDVGPIRRSLRWLQGMAPVTLQIQQLAHLHPDLGPLQMFTHKNTAYTTVKSRLTALADKVIGAWNHPKLPKADYDKVGKVLLDERDGRELWFDLVQKPEGWRYEMSKRADEELRKRGIDVTTEEGGKLAALILEAKNALMIQLNGWEVALETAAKHRHANNMDAYTKQLRVIKYTVHEIRKFPFFPQGRFGNYTLTVETRRSDGRGWQVAHLESFESKTEWEKAVATANKNAKPDERVRGHVISDKHVALLALPYDFVDIAASELALSDEEGPAGEPSEIERLMAILQPARPDKILKQYDLERLKLTGGDKDPLRSFAAFTWHNANLVAKTQFRAEFNATIRSMHALVRQAEYSGNTDEVLRLGRIEQAMKAAKDYIIAPANELQALRTAVSIMYLGLNVKTALLNVYGLVTTWSDLVDRLGTIEGNKLFLKAFAQAAGTIKLTDLNDQRKVGYLSPQLRQAMDRALEEGVLSQSYVYHLAGVANAGTLWRMPAGNSLQRVTHSGVDAAMWLFRLTELSARRASFIAQYEAELIKPTKPTIQVPGLEGKEDPYHQAVFRTNLLMNDYSLGNRVPFMRGGAFGMGPLAPIATIFMSFAQHMAFHAYGGYELGERRAAKFRGENPRTAFGGYTTKIWLVTLLLAGYEGLPGAENLLDLIQILWRKFGGQKPIRQHLREMVQALEVPLLTPGLAAHGLGHNIPLPTPAGIANVDVSRSIGLGRMVPGTDVLSGPGDVPSEEFGTLVLDILGPFGGFLKFGMDAAFGNKPPAEAFERLPGGMGHIYTAYRWTVNGVRAPTGAFITKDLETGELRDLNADEIWAKALGFNPSIVAENRSRRFAQYDLKVYWETRRDMLLDDVWRARLSKDKDDQKAARQAILDFNSSVPKEFRTVRISGADISRSMRSRERNKRLDERGQPSERRYRSVYKDVEESFK